MDMDLKDFYNYKLVSIFGFCIKLQYFLIEKFYDYQFLFSFRKNTNFAWQYVKTLSEV